MAIGDAVSITLGGMRFAIPKDTEPNVVKGGKVITESQDYGDGTADGYFSIVKGKISGLKCKVPENDEDAFKKAQEKDSMPVVLECISKSYECTGYIVGEVEISATKRITNEFEIHVKDGTGIRES